MCFNTGLVVVFILSQVTLIQGQIVLTPYTNPFNIREDRTVEYSLTPVYCTPQTDCLCNLQNPYNDPFDVWKKSAGFEFFYVGAASGSPLSYKTKPTYFLTIECKNSTGGDVQDIIIEIDVLPNQAPAFSKTQDTAPIDASTSKVGDSFYPVAASDPESDPLTYSIKSIQPSSAATYFTIGRTDGIMKIAVDPMTATVNNAIVTVSVTDGRSVVDNFNLDVNIINMNTRPEILNLPATINIPEDQGTPYTIMTLNIFDPDFQPLTTTWTMSPASEAFKFQFDSTTGLLRLLSPLDFEKITQYTFTFVVDDGYLKSQNDVLTLTVLNVNEPPEFDEIAYYCNLDESKAGVSQCDISAKITDPDGDPVPNVALTGTNSNNFRYDMSTSLITFNVDYDVDQPASMTDSLTLQLKATDVNGASSTVPVYITINDVNDNTCDFGVTGANTYTADQGTPTSTTLFSLRATDNDLTSPNNKVTYELVQALPPESSNYMTVFSDGSVVYTGLIPDTNHGKSYSLVVRCKDQGSPQRTAQTTVVLTYLTTTTTSTSTTTTPTTTTTTVSTTTEEYDIWDEEAFVAVFATLMALLALGLIVMTFLLCKLCARACSSGGSDFCFPSKPKPKKVEPIVEDDYFNTEVRTNENFKDDYWKTGDNFESGTNYSAVGNSHTPSIAGGPKRLALPAPHPNAFRF